MIREQRLTPGSPVPTVARVSDVAHISAHAVNTLDWLAAEETTLAVPVYQRRYRWEREACERLLDDVRRVAGAAQPDTHFLGSILGMKSLDELAQLTLIGRQQRLVTLTLLLAALARALPPEEVKALERLDGLLRHPERPDQTRILAHRAHADVPREMALIGAEQEREQDAMSLNYMYFVDAVRDDPTRSGQACSDTSTS
jgi:hypothetical protein